MVRATVSTKRRSGEPSSMGGVPTATNRNRPCSTPFFAFSGEREAPGARVFWHHQLLKPRFIVGDDAFAEALDLGRIDVDDITWFAALRETGTRNETNITSAKYRNAHAGVSWLEMQ